MRAHTLRSGIPQRRPRRKGKKRGKGREEEQEEKIRVVIALKPHERQGPHKNKDKPEGTPGERHSEAKGL